MISVGKGNDYGHPAQSTMDRLKNAGATVYRTDENGTIIATTDGNSISFNVSPGSYSGASSNSPNTTPTPTIPSAPSTPTGHGLIKGNISSNGEKICHMPGGAYYDRTIPEAWFNTEAEAQAAGYRRSSR